MPDFVREFKQLPKVIAALNTVTQGNDPVGRIINSFHGAGTTGLLSGPQAPHVLASRLEQAISRMKELPGADDNTSAVYGKIRMFETALVELTEHYLPRYDRSMQLRPAIRPRAGGKA